MSTGQPQHLDQEQTKELIENWRDHPTVNPKLKFQTLLVPITSLTSLVPKLQPYLAKNSYVMKHIHPRIKMVKEYSDTHKIILLKSNDNEDDETNESVIKSVMNDLQLDQMQVTKGPTVTMDISYSQLSYQYILGQLLTPFGVSIPSAYEQVGHIAHFNFKPIHEPYGKLIAEVLRETNPMIETVVAKVGKVHGKYRTYDFDILAGPSKLETTVVEHGVQIQIHIGDCYWCSRLGGERQLLIQDILHPDTSKGASKKKKELIVADVFSGVGAVCLLLAKEAPVNGQNVTIMANDWNPRAIEYFEKSIKSNAGLNASQFQLSCGDAYDFMMDLGTTAGGGKKNKDQMIIVPDHVLMNFPLHGPTYLGALRWWPWKNVKRYHKVHGSYPRFHIYTFAKGSQNDEGEADDELELAVDIIANELLPVMGSGQNDNGIEDDKNRKLEYHRRKELDEEFGTEFSTRLVRDVAPGKVVVCVSFFLTPKLIRYMQGDYV
jgi:tRNA (guanine37-N1)-methyltransferase